MLLREQAENLFMRLALDKEVKGQDYRVLMYLLAHGGNLEAPLSAIGQELSLDPNNLNKSLIRLERAGVIARIRKNSRKSLTYRVTNEFRYPNEPLELCEA